MREAFHDEDPILEASGASVIVREMNDQEQRPTRRFDDHIVLRDTSRTKITASHCEIIDHNTGELHHHAVKIESVGKPSSHRTLATPKTIWIDDKGRNEIGKLRDFLSVVLNGIPEAVGRYVVVRLEDGEDQSEALHRLIHLASSSEKAATLVRAIESFSLEPETLERLIGLAAENPDAVKAASAALNIARYREGIVTLDSLIRDNAPESAFQVHLEENYWLFGTEYSQLLDLRRATRDEQQDFIVRRTTDDYIEIIEIKTPLNAQKLFIYDRAHNTYYPCAEVTKAVGQVINYIEQLDTDRTLLLHRDQLDTNKIRAKIVIGRSGDANQMKALRNLNGHLHRIEVMTFDQLARIGHRVLQHLESVIKQTGPQGSAQVVEDNADLLWDDSEPPF